MSEHISMSDVESSQIAAIGHDPKTNTLAVQFKNYKGERKGLYHYANVDAETFAAFRDSASKGAHFGQHIKPFPEKYPYTRVGG